jgi:hypothetical protein
MTGRGADLSSEMIIRSRNIVMGCLQLQIVVKLPTNMDMYREQHFYVAIKGTTPTRLLSSLS